MSYLGIWFLIAMLATAGLSMCLAWNEYHKHPNNNYTLLNLVSSTQAARTFDLPWLPLLMIANFIPIINLFLILFYLVYFFSEILMNLPPKC